MEEDEEVYKCLSCRRKISRDEYEAYDGFCQDCYGTEIAELDVEND